MCDCRPFGVLTFACIELAEIPQGKASHYSPPRSGEESPGVIPSFSSKSRAVAAREKSLSFALHPDRPYFPRPSFP